MPKEGKWVAHYVEKTVHLGAEYHNRLLPVPSNVAPQFFIVRLAWVIFPRVKNFCETGVPRLLRVQEKQVDTGEYIETDKTLGTQDMARQLAVGRGRSSSPRKRVAQGTLDACDLISPPYFNASSSFSAGTATAPAATTCLATSRVHLPPLNGRLQDEVDDKVRHNNDHCTSATSPCQDDPSIAPDLIHTQSTPLSAPSSTFPPRLMKRRRSATDEELDQDEQHRISRLRRSALLQQRPINPSLICCDYSAAERAHAHGEHGKTEFGGGHLCMECLGLELRQEDEP